MVGQTAGMGLPADFVWGVATSDVLARGAAPRSDWRRWEEDRALESSSEGVGFATGANSDDFERLAQLGLHHVAITAEWARIEPYGGSIEAAELERLIEVFTAAREAGLQPWAILHHGSLPGWFSEDTEGFRRGIDVSAHWSRQVDRAAECLDGLAAGWIPSVDPIGWAIDSHRLGLRPPGRRNSDADSVADAVEGALAASFEAWRLLSSGDRPVLAWFGQGHDESDLWIEAVRDGIFRPPNRAPVEREEWADAFDLIGLDWADPSDPERLADRLHEIPDLLPGRDVLLCGCSIDTADEGKRERALSTWLDSTAEAIDDGVAVRGMVFEPALDGYDFARGRTGNRGLLTIDREPKPAFRWIEAQR